MSKVSKLIKLIGEASGKTYLDIGSLKGTQINKLVKELQKTGLKLGKDFFIQSGRESWILNTKYDIKQVDILDKYKVEEI